MGATSSVTAKTERFAGTHSPYIFLPSHTKAEFCEAPPTKVVEKWVWSNILQTALIHSFTLDLYLMGCPCVLKCFIKSNHALSILAVRFRGLKDSGNGVSVSPLACSLSLQSTWILLLSLSLPPKQPCYEFKGTVFDTHGEKTHPLDLK